MEKSFLSRLFDISNYTFFVFVSVSMIFPFLNILCLSLEPNYIAIETGVIHIIPKAITYKAYVEIWQNSYISTAFMNSVFITVVGAFLGVVISSMIAYGLSFDRIPGHKALSYIVLFTMMFSGGIIPLYILIKQLGMINSLWSLIIPSLLSAYNIILMRTFFKELPVSLSESALLDGCTEAGIFFRIVLPLSTPIIATITLFYAVAKWNSFFDAVMYITEPSKKPLQLILREILIQSGDPDTGGDLDIGMNVKMATAIVTIVPILCVYPFLQKYFTKGILLGAVKG